MVLRHDEEENLLSSLPRIFGLNIKANICKLCFPFIQIPSFMRNCLVVHSIDSLKSYVGSLVIIENILHIRKQSCYCFGDVFFIQSVFCTFCRVFNYCCNTSWVKLRLRCRVDGFSMTVRRLWNIFPLLTCSRCFLISYI